MTRIVFIGGGNMARSLIGGLLKSGMPASAISVAEPNADTRDRLAREFGITSYAENPPAVMGAEVVVLAVKPKIIPALGVALRDHLQQQRPLLISIAAGVRLAQLENGFGTYLSIVRSMPNTPALIAAGATALCANPRVSPIQRVQTQHIFDTVGITRWVDEEAQLDTVTALSGSGPAYFFALVEALENAAVSQGLPPDTARALAIQTCLGAGRMLSESGESPTALRQRVTSPHGTTQAALTSLAADDLTGVVTRAITAATQRSKQLAAELELCS